jgi:hypothetical protein
MTKIQIRCASGVGDALIFHMAAYNLSLHGHQVFLDTPHDFGRFLPSYPPLVPDVVFLQHDNQPKNLIPTFTFYGSHNSKKHPPLRPGYDYVCQPNLTMVDNLLLALKALFQINPVPEIGLTPLGVYKKYPKRVAIQKECAPEKNWGRFDELFPLLKDFEPTYIPQFPTLEELLTYIYESGFVLSNDSSPGHIASAFHIPHLVIAQNARHMRLWRPGWSRGKVITPPLPNWKALRPYWRKFISVQSIVKNINIGL